MKKPCSEMFCLRNQDITDAKAFFYLFFMSNSGYVLNNLRIDKYLVFTVSIGDYAIFIIKIILLKT